MESAPGPLHETASFMATGDLLATPAYGARQSLPHLAPLRVQVRTHPNDPQAHLALAEALHQAGRHEQAVGPYIDAINLAGADHAPVVAYMHLIEALHANGRDEQALHIAQEGAATCGGEPGFWLVIGQCHVRLGETAAGITAFERCLDLPATPLSEQAPPHTQRRDAYIGLSLCYDAQGAVVEAEKALLNAEWIASGDWQVLQARLGKLLQVQPLSDVGDRLGHVLDAMHGKDRRQLTVALAGALWLAGRQAESHDLLVQAWQSAGEADMPAALVDVAQVLFAAGQTVVALDLLDEHRGLPGVAETMAIQLFRLGQWADLQALCDSVWDQPEAQAFAAAYRGIARFRQGDFAGADADLRLAVSLDPDNVSAWHNLGMLAISRDRLDDAHAAFLAIVDLHRLDPAAPVNLARIALMQQDTGGVEHWLAEAFNALPPVLSAAVQQAEPEDLLGQPELITPFGWRLLVADLCAVWGALMLGYGDKDEGLQRLSLAVALSPGNGNYYLLIAMGLHGRHADRLATCFFQAASVCMPQLALARECLAEIAQARAADPAAYAAATPTDLVYLEHLVTRMTAGGEWP